MKSFIKALTNTVFATEEQRKNEIWDVEGRLKNGNQPFSWKKCEKTQLKSIFES